MSEADRPETDHADGGLDFSGDGLVPVRPLVWGSQPAPARPDPPPTDDRDRVEPATRPAGAEPGGWPEPAGNGPVSGDRNDDRAGPRDADDRTWPGPGEPRRPAAVRGRPYPDERDRGGRRDSYDPAPAHAGYHDDRVDRVDRGEYRGRGGSPEPGYGDRNGPGGGGRGGNGARDGDLRERNYYPDRGELRGELRGEHRDDPRDRERSRGRYDSRDRNEYRAHTEFRERTGEEPAGYYAARRADPVPAVARDWDDEPETAWQHERGRQRVPSRAGREATYRTATAPGHPAYVDDEYDWERPDYADPLWDDEHDWPESGRTQREPARGRGERPPPRPAEPSPERRRSGWFRSAERADGQTSTVAHRLTWVVVIAGLVLAFALGLVIGRNGSADQAPPPAPGPTATTR